MADSHSTPDDTDDAPGATAEEPIDPAGDGQAGVDGPSDGSVSGGDGESIEALRERVEQQYDFDDFGPADMAEMTAEEWEAAFDADSWITGDELLDRVYDDLTSRVADRDVFARVERHRDPERVLAYSDNGYALVYPDGTVEGEGTVLRDVKPSVALCSMDSYDVPEPPVDDPLPAPGDVPEGGGELGNLMLQVVAAAQLLAGLALLGGGVLSIAGVIGGPGANPALIIVAGLGFVGIALILFLTVANARLSDKFRAEEYRDRLRAIGLDDGERPEFVPSLEGRGDAERAERDSDP